MIYIATANSLGGIQPSVLSRFEIFSIELPEPREAVETACRLAKSLLARLGLNERLRFDPKGYYVLAHLTDAANSGEERCRRGAEKRSEVSEADLSDEARARWRQPLGEPLEADDLLVANLLFFMSLRVNTCLVYTCIRLYDGFAYIAVKFEGEPI